MEFGFEPVCDQLRTSFEPASVMEFGFERSVVVKIVRVWGAQGGTSPPKLKCFRKLYSCHKLLAR